MATIRWAAALLVLALAGACGGTDGGGDTSAPPDGSADLAATDDTLADAADDPGGPLPVCACPVRPASGACRSCSTLDNGCEQREGRPWAVRCSIAQGCLEAEDCSNAGPLAGCDAGHCTHVDPGPDVGPEPDVVEVIEVVEAIEPGSRQVGEACTDSADCANAMTCVSGQYTMAHCNPMCATVEDCTAAYPGGNATCAALSGGSVCIWFCGMMGGQCPGDLACDDASCG